jgi:hypothetical protein
VPRTASSGRNEAKRSHRPDHHDVLDALVRELVGWRRTHDVGIGRVRQRCRSGRTLIATRLGKTIDVTEFADRQGRAQCRSGTVDPASKAGSAMQPSNR